MSLSQAYASTTAGSGLSVLLREVRMAVGKTLEQRRARSRARQELEAYSDRQLKDLGINRSDIPSIVDGSFAR